MIREFQTPRDVRGIGRFIGVVNFTTYSAAGRHYRTAITHCVRRVHESAVDQLMPEVL